MDVVSREVDFLPIFKLNNTEYKTFHELTKRLLTSYNKNKTERTRQGERINVEEINIVVSKSKHIIDEIDRVLAKHYGFT